MAKVTPTVEVTLTKPFEIHTILCDGTTMKEEFESSLPSWRRYSQLIIMGMGHKSLTPENSNVLIPQHVWKISAVHRDRTTGKVKRKVDSDTFTCPDHVGKLPTS